MTDKTERKIEATAATFGDKNYCSTNEIEAQSNAEIAFQNGATPWAEWCERFEQSFWHCEKVLEESGSYPDDMIELMKEYRQWLEDVDG